MPEKIKRSYWVGTIETRHFSFLGVSDVSEEDCRVLLLSAWLKHVALTGADPMHVGAEDVQVLELHHGEVLLDDMPFYSTDETE